MESGGGQSMISRDFIYTRPDTKEEAVSFFCECEEKGMAPCYYAGGSEIITMCRAGSAAPGAVVDIKSIPETNTLAVDRETLVIGSCVTLRAIKDSRLFPLLGQICGRIADHTNQCRITIGGNLCGTIIYRETAQALLLTDADVLLFGPDGLRLASIHDAFDGRMRLKPGECILQVRVPARFLNAPFNHVKKTAAEKIDYPLLSMSTLLDQDTDTVRIAMSGLYAYPLRSRALEDAFNAKELDGGARKMQAMLTSLPGPPREDYQGSSEYRLFVLRQTLAAMMEIWKR